MENNSHKSDKMMVIPESDKPVSLPSTVHNKTMQDVLNIAGRVAKYDSSVLITGETGVGKEIVARYIHAVSHRSEGPLLSVNCGALPETLLESELFGHKAGSFTGAFRDRVGLFEQAARGTILLDEIGDISLVIQVKLLRVLQEREILRIGESIPRKVDIRVIAATNRNLDRAVSEGRFREDLLYRLRVIEIEVPPLRVRRDDILPLIKHIIKKMSKKLNLPHLRLDNTCLEYLRSYSWPGNVRELENALERAAVLSGDGVIVPEYLPPQMLNYTLPDQRVTMSAPRTLAEVEMDYIRQVLQSTNGNRAQAAKILGISPTTLWRKLKNAD